MKRPHMAASAAASMTHPWALHFWWLTQARQARQVQQAPVQRHGPVALLGGHLQGPRLGCLQQLVRSHHSVHQASPATTPYNAHPQLLATFRLVPLVRLFVEKTMLNSICVAFMQFDAFTSLTSDMSSVNVMSTHCTQHVSTSILQHIHTTPHHTTPHHFPTPSSIIHPSFPLHTSQHSHYKAPPHASPPPQPAVSHYHHS